MSKLKVGSAIELSIYLGNISDWVWNLIPFITFLALSLKLSCKRDAKNIDDDQDSSVDNDQSIAHMIDDSNVTNERKVGNESFNEEAAEARRGGSLAFLDR